MSTLSLSTVWARLPPLPPTTPRLPSALVRSLAALTLVYLLGRVLLPLAGSATVDAWRLGPGLGVFVLAATLCWLRARHVERDRAAWRLCAVAILLFAAGTLINKVFGTPTSSPVAGHLAWTGFYVCLYAALALMARSALSPFPWSYLLDAVVAVLVLASLLLVAADVFGPSGYRPWEAPLAIAYPSLDLLLLGFIGWASGAGAVPQRRAWLLVVLGLAAILVGDLVLLGMGIAGALSATAVYTAAFPVGMAFLGIAAWATPPRPSVLRSRSAASLKLPLACGVVALIVVTFGIASTVGPIPAGVALFALLVVTVRSVLVYRDLVAMQLARRFERGFEDAGIGMALIDSAGRWTRINPALAAVLGGVPEMFVGRPVRDRVAPADQATVLSLMTELRGGGTRIDPRALTVITRSGIQRNVLIAGDVIDDDGDTQLFAQVRDVTAEHRAAKFGEVVVGLSRAALASADVDALLQQVTGATADALGAPMVAVVVAVERTGAARVMAPAGSLRPELREALAAAQHPVSTALERGEVVDWQDLAPGDGLTAQGLLDAELESAHVFPIVPSVGPPAALCVGYETARSAIAADERRFLESIANLLTTALERSRREALSHHEALHDALTGLANRTLLSAHVGHALERARRDGRPVGGVLIDLDRFKNVNDTLGHQVGDALLVQVAARLARVVRGGDLVARLGGDEFVVIFDRPAGLEPLRRFAQRIIEAFKEPFMVDGRELVVGTSIGIAVAHSADGSADTLIRDADVAMYRAKAGGGGQFAVFDAALRAELVARVDTERQLRHAVARGELRLVLQPQISLCGDRLPSFEALVRWARPGVGLVAPGSFVQVAEDTGLIVPLGTWVLREAVAWAAHRQLEFGVAPIVSVNLSGRQLTDDLPAIVAAALEEAGLDSAHLCLELTESMLIADPQATAIVSKLRAMGVRLSLDDFGTGWSSLAALQRHPVDELKLDRSMITALGIDDASAAITRAAVEMALALGLTVVAEGIEEPRQLEAVRELGCQVAQGFLFARPLTPEQADAYLEARTWHALLEGAAGAGQR